MSSFSSLDSTLSTQKPLSFNLASTGGPVLVGCCIQLILFGVGSMQAYLYFWNYGADAIRLKGMVTMLWILETIDATVGFAILWRVFVSDNGDPDRQERDIGICVVQGLIESIVACSVQLYLIHRVWRFTNGKRRIFPLFLMVLVLWPPAGKAWFLGLSFNRIVSTFGSPVRFGIVSSVTAVMAFVDTSIAVGMIALLAPHRTQYSNTRGIIHRLQLLIINTSLFTAFFSISTLIIYVSHLYTLDLLATYTPIGAAYFCCLLTNLNARQFVRGEGGLIIVTDVEAVRASDIVFASQHDMRTESDACAPVLDISGSKVA